MFYKKDYLTWKNNNNNKCQKETILSKDEKVL